MAQLDWGWGYEQFLSVKGRAPRPTEVDALKQLTIGVLNAVPIADAIATFDNCKYCVCDPFYDYDAKTGKGGIK